MSGQPGITPSSVFVVSGGGRGITARCVVELARHYGCKFILLGRTVLTGQEPPWAAGDEAGLKKRLADYLAGQGEKPTPLKVQKLVNEWLAQREINQTLQEIAAVGGQAIYLGVDITDQAALQVALDGAVAQFGPVTGILHGAGNLADKLIENKTAEDFELVYAAKVTGLENLLRCLPPGQLSHLILFSSVAGFYGNSGQADYALANEIINKTAHTIKHHHPACHVLTLNWGPWDGGMVTPALKEFFAQRQIAIIPVESGTHRLVEELDAGVTDKVQVVVGSPLRYWPGQLSEELKTYRLRRKLTLEANPFLLDHVIGGNPVLPAICVINWVANACEQLYPGYTFFSSEGNKVLKGVIFDASLADEYTLELKEVAKESGREIVIDGTIWSKNENGRLQYHYSARTTLRREIPPRPVYTSFNPTPSQVVSGAALYENGTLFHGPSFQGVKQVLNLSRESVTLECYLPRLSERQQGQFPVQNFNPYGVDVQLQCLLIWARHFYQAASLPLKIQRVDQYRTLPFDGTYFASLEVQTSSETGLVANVTAHDASGRVYTVVTGAEVTISPRLNRLFVPSGRSALAAV
jgi:NAD(P)-dependent dehydrogenase (short-subunit alcohol dehydrogenase family)